MRLPVDADPVTENPVFGSDICPPSPTGIGRADDPTDDSLVFTVAEAGSLLGISRAFAYELVARGELPVIRLGRRRLVPKVALLALVGSGTTDGHSPPAALGK
jgi:excisionase family DNA binding protein